MLFHCLIILCVAQVTSHGELTIVANPTSQNIPENSFTNVIFRMYIITARQRNCYKVRFSVESVC